MNLPIDPTKNSTPRYFWVWSILLGAFACWMLWDRMQLDFWNDELYTLKFFTFVPISQTLTDYHVPNNHLFCNLLNNLYLKLAGIDSMEQLMDHPVLLRMVPAAYALWTLLGIYRLGKRLVSRETGWLTALVLLTSLPYVWFVVQIRGYGLSAALLVMGLNFAVAYLQGGKRRKVWGLGLATCLLMYTVPSNAYPILGMMLGLAFQTLGALAQDRALGLAARWQKAMRLRTVHLGLAMGLGVVASLGLYAPVFRSVFMNRYVVPGPRWEFSKLGYYLPNLMEGIVSGRWVLIVLCLAATIWAVWRYRRMNVLWGMMLGICLIPFVMVIVRGDNPPLRVFVVNFPVYALLCVAAIGQWLKDRASLNPIFRQWILGGMAIYCMATCLGEWRGVEDRIQADIVHGRRSQDLYRQYFSHHYRPWADVQYLDSCFREEPLPIMVHSCEPHGIGYYLDKFNLSHVHEHWRPQALDSLLSVSDSLYVLTNERNFYDAYADLEVSQLSPNPSYHNLLKLRKAPSLLKIRQQMNDWASEKGDSILCISQSKLPAAWQGDKLDSAVMVLSPQMAGGWGDILAKASEKSYLFWVKGPGIPPASVEKLLFRNRQPVLQDTIAGGYIRYVGKWTPQPETWRHQFVEDFEEWQGSEYAGYAQDQQPFKGRFSLQMEKQHEYADLLKIPLAEASGSLEVEFQLQASFPAGNWGMIVVTILRDGNRIFTENHPFRPFTQPKSHWQPVWGRSVHTDSIQPGDVLQVFVWNSDHQVIGIDDVTIQWK
ncbi:hypothetical protein [Pontibacter sp. G13]|uniref:ArnT family glycosyltransferase n=1 Tax=Pontibacter sp. G13 TaxID=3074898 RepID=UPI002889AA3F|nr:hypothetical protein [Pontibacter sp. G13]WNJ20119.1 hypothetical protein RJD25_06510 [Pontibacter sp. G13]